jgi:cellobiose-specific phosphotransferase system component IIA
MSYTPTTRIPLTPAQIRQFDEISRDKSAAEATLKVALGFHTNVLNMIAKTEKTLWDELVLIHGLDIDNLCFKTMVDRGEVVIVDYEGGKQP